MIQKMGKPKRTNAVTPGNPNILPPKNILRVYNSEFRIDVNKKNCQVEKSNILYT
jgi:hypothetical protein